MGTCLGTINHATNKQVEKQHCQEVKKQKCQKVFFSFKTFHFNNFLDCHSCPKLAARRCLTNTAGRYRWTSPSSPSPPTTTSSSPPTYPVDNIHLSQVDKCREVPYKKCRKVHLCPMCPEPYRRPLLPPHHG